MELKAIKSKIITPGDGILEVIFKNLKDEPLKNGDIFVITSKIIAVSQGRIAKIDNNKDFENLVKKEAEKIYGGKIAALTLKNGIFIPWAGIDRSNIKKGYAVLWPEEPYKEALKLWKALRKKYNLKKLGVIICDSICLPLRKGVSAIALGYAGFKGVEDVRREKDLYGNKLKVTQKAAADMLSAAANLEMGEGNESKPFVIIRNAPVKFTNAVPKKDSLVISRKDCLYAPLHGKK
jgi:coenzyme F420-0:L-glutamate ligase